MSVEMSKRYNITCGLYDSSILKSGVAYRQNDNNVYPLTICLQTKQEYNNKPTLFAIPNDAEVWLFFIRPDGVTDKIRAVVSDHKKGIVKCEMNGSAISVSGVCFANVEVWHSGKKLSWSTFQYTVIAIGDNNPEPPEAYANWVDEINAMILELKEKEATETNGTVTISETEPEIKTSVWIKPIL